MLSRAHHFDHQTQSISIIKADGITPITIRPYDIDNWNLYNVRSSISFGFQAGAFAVMFVMTAVLTKSTRRRTPVHILNLISLLLGFFRGLFQALYFTSDWDGFFPYFTNDFSEIKTQNYVLSIFSIIIPLLFAATITSSLVLQAYTVTKLVTQKLHFMTTFISVSILLVAVGLRFANAIMNCKAVMSASPYFDFHWLQLSVLVTETMTIWFFSLIFTGKLVYTMWTRKNMGLDSWSHMQILSVMSTCTMIIPSIFAIFLFIDLPTFPSIETWPLTIVALLLPLSALWASMIINQNTSSFEISKIWSESSQTLSKKCSCGHLTGKSHSKNSSASSEWAQNCADNSAPPINNTTTNTTTTSETLENDPRKNNIKIKDKENMIPDQTYGKSRKLTSLISRFEEMDTVSSLQTVSRRVSKQVSWKSSEKAGLLNPQLESSQLKNKFSPGKGNMEERNVINLPSPELLKLHFRNKSDFERRDNSKISFDEVNRIETIGAIEDQDLRRDQFSMLNSKNKNKRTKSLQEKIKTFDSSISTKEHGEKKSSAIKSMASTLKVVRQEQEVDRKLDSLLKLKPKSAPGIVMNLSTVSSNLKPSYGDKILESMTPTNELLERNLSSSNLVGIIPLKSREVLDLSTMIKRPCLPEAMPYHTISGYDLNQRFGNLSLETSKDKRCKRYHLNEEKNSRNESRRFSDKNGVLFRQRSNQAPATEQKDQNKTLGSYLSSEPHPYSLASVYQDKLSAIKGYADDKKLQEIPATKKKFESKISSEEAAMKVSAKSAKVSYSNVLSLNQDEKLPKKNVKVVRSLNFSTSLPKLNYFTNKDPLFSDNIQQNDSAEVPVKTMKLNFPMSTQMTSQLNEISSQRIDFRDKEKSIQVNPKKLDSQLAEKQRLRSNSGLVGDKVKQFEGIQVLQKKASMLKRNNIIRKLDCSLRGVFENWNSREKSKKFTHCLSKDKTEGSPDEFQYLKSGQFGQKHISSKKTASHEDFPTNDDIERSVGKDIDKFSRDVDLWLIKRVNCGLTQPKPRRAVEVQRMIVMCRDKVGSIDMANDDLA